jgi:isopenicillin-N epimerase
MADGEAISVALSTELDDELRLEKRVRDLIREINVRRKQEGLEITDRIVVTLTASDADLIPAHGEWIKQETLAVALREGLNELRQFFLLDPKVVFLNHGSFGACPWPVFDAYQRWQRELERQPVEFLARRYAGLVDEARKRLAAYLGAGTDDVVFVPNATAGMNVVARSLRLEPRDEVLLTNHEYGAVDFLWEHVCGQAGAKLVRQAVDPGPDLVDELFAAVTPRTRIVSVSHITSASALRSPVEEICRRGRGQGILVAVDGAHAPGQVDVDLESLGADFYAGNCHKWRGCKRHTWRWRLASVSTTRPERVEPTSKATLQGRSVDAQGTARAGGTSGRSSEQRTSA